MSFDIYELVTNRIIEQLEQGVIPWHKPWKTGLNIKGAEDLKKVAFNRVTKTAYSALNQMLLSRAGEYASFKQWKELGGSIKKGAKSEIVVFWKMYQIKDEKLSTENETIFKKIPLLKYMQVFHIEDVTGVNPLEIQDEKTPAEFEPVEQAEELAKTYLEREKIDFAFGGDSAYYSPTMDCIQLPNKYQFGQKSGEYYSTLFHEITHSTGAKHRLDRFSSNAFFGNEDYSKEELVAEIGASGILNLLNIEKKSTFQNSVAYIQGWLKKLKDDKKLIVSASARAEKAIKYIINGKTEEEQGADE